MYARATSVQSTPGPTDDNLRYIDQNVRPTMLAQGGSSVDALLDGQSGHGYVISYWKDAEAARMSEAAANQVRERSRQDLSLQILDVHTYEVTFEDNVQGAQPRAARVTPSQGDASRIDEMTQWTSSQLVPTYRAQPGYCGWRTLTDRQLGKSLIISLWESTAQMRAAETLLGQSRARGTQEQGLQFEPTQRYEVGAQPIVQTPPTQQPEARP